MANHDLKADGFTGERAIVTPYQIRDMQDNNPITRHLYVTHIGYYPQASKHYRERVQGTNENILIYCEHGKGWIETDDGVFFLKEHELFILPANKRHAYAADKKSPWSIYWMHFKGDATPMLASIIGRPISISGSNQYKPNMRLQLFEEIYNTLEMGYSHDNMEYITFCLLYFLATIRYLPQYNESDKTANDDIIQKCIHYMREHIERKISVSAIAKAVGYSPSHLNTMFVQRTSFSPIQYYNQLKIQRACHYLQFSELKIKEIAFQLGYYDPFHLSKAFSQEMGISPRQYRAKYKTKDKKHL